MNTIALTIEDEGKACLDRLTAQLEAELAGTKLLQDLSAQLSEEENDEALYAKLVDAAVAIMHADYASIQMLFPERGNGGELLLLGFRGFNPQAAKFWQWVSVDSASTCGAVLNTHRRVIVPDVDKSDFMAGTQDLATYRHTGIRAVQSTPLVSRDGKLVGIISTHWSRPYEPPERDLRLLDILARQAADLIERRRAQAKLRKSEQQKDTLYRLVDRLHRAEHVEDVYAAAMDAVKRGLQCARASVLLFDQLGVMRFVASSGLSEAYRRAVEGHSPWSADERDPQPVCLSNVAEAGLPDELRTTVDKEGIAALAFVPLMSQGRLIGKFMAYFDEVHDFATEEIEFALAIAKHIAFGIDRGRAADALRENERRFREMIDALPAAIYTTDAHGRLTHFNPAAVEFSGRVPVLGLDHWCVSWKLYHADGKPMPHESCPMAIAIKEGKIVNGAEAIAELPDGTRRWFTPYPNPVKDAQGRVVGGINMLVDITQRKLAEQEKAKLVNQLRESDRRKDEFIAVLSHELRNPLAPIRTAVDLLRAAPGDAHIVSRVQGILDRQIRHMVALVDDLLDVSRIITGNITLNKRAVELSEIVRNAVELSRPAIDAGAHRLEVLLPGRAIHLFVDPVRMAQVIANLLNNSARYTKTGGKITLAANSDVDHAVIRVRDNGIGIAAELLPHIFEFFVQGVSKNRPVKGGLGIGLPLARKLIEMQQGTVEGRSDGPGLGSEFVVRIPILHTAPTTQTESADPDAAVALPRRILVVDDNVDAADTIGLLLKQMGHHVHVAYDGETAVKEASAARPEIILLDLSLPDTDGYTLAERLRAGGNLNGVRIIALTGHGREHDHRRSRDAGFDDHLVKPVGPEVLRAAVAATHSASLAL